MRINIYRGQVDTNNANSTKNGANGVKCGADDGTNGTEVPLNKCYITTRTKEGEQKEMIKIPPTGV